MVAGSPLSVQRRIAAFLRARGFSVAAHGEGTGLGAEARAGSLDPAWVRCELVLYADLYGDDGRRMDWARPTPVAGEVHVRLAAASGGTEVSVAARFPGSFHDRFVNLAREGACQSTGELERAILAAAG